MSLRDYEISREIGAQSDWGEDFYALVMVLMRNADTDNQAKLRAAWPEIWIELEQRHNAPAGLLIGEHKPEGEEGEGMLERRQDGLYHVSPDGEAKLVRAL